MELKLYYAYPAEDGVYCSNRTFMELKYYPYVYKDLPITF